MAEAESTEQSAPTKHAGGRPLLFETPKELLDKAQGYFEETPKLEWTITGLAVYLDTSRETLMNYEHRDKFFDTIKKLKDMIEASYELSLRKRGGSGDIFGLKNFGWKDKTEVDTNVTGELKTEGLNPELAQKWQAFLEKQTLQ